MAEEYRIKWQAPEYIYTEKGRDWYWVLGIIGLALIVVSVIMENYLFSVLLLISFLAIILHSHKLPLDLEYEINKNGIAVNGELESFTSFESYRVETEHVDSPKLLLKSHKLFQPLIAIHLDGADPDEISNYLAYFLPEEDLHEPVSHKLMEYLGF